MKLITPVKAFITFTNQEAYERCNNSLFDMKGGVKNTEKTGKKPFTMFG